MDRLPRIPGGSSFCDYANVCLVDRYGLVEVSRWYFEIWNEPNLNFWAGEPEEATYYTPPNETGSTEKFGIQLKEAAQIRFARIHLVDEDHGSPLKAWKAMGSPSFPSLQQQAKLSDWKGVAS